jgi:hypothetical protein
MLARSNGRTARPNGPTSNFDGSPFVRQREALRLERDVVSLLRASVSSKRARR